MITRKLKWNRKTNTDEQPPYFRYRYTFAAVNEPREINRIKERIIEQMAPVDNLEVHYECPIPKSHGLHCEIFSISSTFGTIQNPEKIYNSKNFRKDRNLAERDEGDLEIYARNLIRS